MEYSVSEIILMYDNHKCKIFKYVLKNYLLFINTSFKLKYYVKTHKHNFSNFYSQRCVMYFALTQHQ